MTDAFFDIQGNPRPRGIVPGTITAPDGLLLRYALTPSASGPSRGTVVVLTGRNECIEKYFETMRDLGERGLGTAIMDWRGQGGSARMLADGERGHVAAFDDYVADLDRFFAEVVLPDCRGPYFLLGHSTGALIALLAAPTLANRIQRMVLVAPFLSVTGLPFSMAGVSRLASTLYWLGMGKRYAYGGRRPPEPAPFATNTVTTDQERYRRNTLIYARHPHLALGGPTVSWVRAACAAARRVEAPAFMDALNLPILFVAAGDDEVVSTRAIEAYARRLKSASLLTIDGARHEILQEADIYREQFFAAFDAFVPGSVSETA